MIERRLGSWQGCQHRSEDRVAGTGVDDDAKELIQRRWWVGGDNDGAA